MKAGEGTHGLALSPDGKLLYSALVKKESKPS
jgi:sugar lactone lactonase YvrE